MILCDKKYSFVCGPKGCGVVKQPDKAGIYSRFWFRHRLVRDDVLGSQSVFLRTKDSDQPSGWLLSALSV